MTKEEILDLNSRSITEEELEELRKSDYVDDIKDLGPASMYPALTWYLIITTDNREVNVFV